MSADDVRAAVRAYAEVRGAAPWPDAQCARHGGITSLNRVDPETGRRRISWRQADPEVHILAMAVDDDEIGPLVADVYRLRERCPHYDAWHAVRHERPLSNNAAVRPCE